MAKMLAHELFHIENDKSYLLFSAIHELAKHLWWSEGKQTAAVVNASRAANASHLVWWRESLVD